MNDETLAPPDSIPDRWLRIFTGPKPRVLTVGCEPLRSGSSVATFAMQQLAAAARDAKRFEVLGVRTGKVCGLPAVDQSVRYVADGRRVLERQVFIGEGSLVHTVTIRVPREDEAQIKPTLDIVLSTLGFAKAAR
jgi:hypothetical protein